VERQDVHRETKEMFGTLIPGDATLAAVDRFNQAFARHDVAGTMAAMTADCVFESTAPPDGVRYEGTDEVRAAWEGFFRSSPGASFDTEECLAAGDRAIVRWRYRWANADGTSGHVRGVDLFLVRDGKVAEKLSYVKG
jgi:ketosteroid isomerase-like protein